MLNNTLSSLSSTLSEEQKKEFALYVARGNLAGEISLRSCNLTNAFYGNRNACKRNFTMYDLFASLGISHDDYSNIYNEVRYEEYKFLSDYANKIVDGCIENESEEKTKCLCYYGRNLPYFYIQLNYALMSKAYYAAEAQLESMNYKKRKSLRAGVNYDIVDIEDIRDNIYKGWLNNPDALIAYFVGKCLVTFANWEWFIKTMADIVSSETIEEATGTIGSMLSDAFDPSFVWAKTLRKSRSKKTEDDSTINTDKSEE